MTVITGLDVQSIDEVSDSIVRFGERYLTRLYSVRELEECGTNRESLAANLALRFAAKEAVIKALRPHDHIPPWRSIEVLLHPRGAPQIVLSGEAEELADQRGVETMSVSVGLARDYAIAAIVVAIRRDVTSKEARP